MGLFNVFKKKEVTNTTQLENDMSKDVVKTYILEFPYRGIIKNEDEAADDEYINGKDLYSYLDKDTVDGISYSWYASEMISIIDDEKIKNKLHKFDLYIRETGVCNVFIEVYHELTDEEKDYLLDFVKGQASDGWGEGDFDYIYDIDNKELYFYWEFKEKAKDKNCNCIVFSIDFWWYDNSWYIKYI